jgi:antitoxin component YwqK of YwqJK toxin-antitoxin module
MKTNFKIMSIILAFAGFFIATQVSAQNANCKVRDKDIAEIYKGGCKDGLAQGKGLAKGRDVFEGQFFEGDKVKGKYTWANGTYYDGDWKNDHQHGKGKMVNSKGELIFEGEWVEGKMQGVSEQYKKAAADACEIDLGAYRVKICGADQTTNNFRCILDAQEKYAAYKKYCASK